MSWIFTGLMWLAEQIGWRWAHAELRKLTDRPAFYPDRDTLEAESPLGKKLKDSNSIDAIWGTGIKSLVDKPFIGQKIKRLLLPDPNAESTKRYQSEVSPPRDICGEICTATRLARDKKITVRWLNEFPWYRLMIGNRGGPKSWMQIEMLSPGTHAGEDMSLQFQESKHKETIDRMAATFDVLWTDRFSKDPPD